MEKSISDIPKAQCTFFDVIPNEVNAIILEKYLKSIPYFGTPCRPSINFILLLRSVNGLLCGAQVIAVNWAEMRNRQHGDRFGMHFRTRGKSQFQDTKALVKLLGSFVTNLYFFSFCITAYAF